MFSNTGLAGISVIVLCAVIAVIALVDILKSDFNRKIKLFWVLMVVLTGFLGAILYYAIGRHQKIKN
jgi:predicted CDP-diglyceride synthetase/phosphatidate cytidylyltransferase